MKILDQYTTSMIGAEKVKEKQKKAEKIKGGRTAALTDGVQISGRSHEVAHARSLALAAPEIRQALVDEVVDLMKKGKYDITGEDVAPRMINDHLSLWT